MTDIVVIAHNLRSAQNVGSLLRTAEGLAVSEVILSGYTPYPIVSNDERMPHIASKIDRSITKVSLGAETYLKWRHEADIFSVIADLKKDGYTVVSVEQTDHSIDLKNYSVPSQVALIFGREVEGIEPEVLSVSDQSVEIPMLGKKESFNVVQAAAMVLYHCRFL